MNIQMCVVLVNALFYFAKTDVLQLPISRLMRITVHILTINIIVIHINDYRSARNAYRERY